MIAKLRKFVCHPVTVFLLTFLAGWLTLEQINVPMPDETIAIPYSSGHYAEITHANDTHLLVCAHLNNGLKTRFGWPGKEREYVVDTSTKIVTPLQKVGKGDARRWLKNGKLACLDFVDAADDVTTLSIRVFDPKQKTIEAVVVPYFTQKLWSNDGSFLVLGRSYDTHPFTIEVITFEDGITRKSHTFPKRLGGIGTSGEKIAVSAWCLSEDGKFLALAEAWERGNRVTDQGIEIIHLPTMKRDFQTYNLDAHYHYQRIDPTIQSCYLRVTQLYPLFGKLLVGVMPYAVPNSGSITPNLKANLLISFSDQANDDPVRIAASGLNGTLTLSQTMRLVNSDAFWLFEDSTGQTRLALTDPLATFTGRLPVFNVPTEGSSHRQPVIGAKRQGKGALLIQPSPSFLSKVRERIASVELIRTLVDKLGLPASGSNAGPYEFHWWDFGTNNVRPFHTMRSVKDDIGNPAMQPGKVWIMSNSPSGATLHGWDLPPKPRSPIRLLVNLGSACLLASLVTSMVKKRSGQPKSAKLGQPDKLDNAGELSP